MKSYKYLRLYYDSGGITFKTFDNDLKAWLFTEIKNIVPNCVIKSPLHSLVPDMADFKITNLSHRDIEIANIILQKLLNNGWEPFQIDTYSSDRINSEGRYSVYHLRLTVE
jgi:hypothetical protein